MGNGECDEALGVTHVLFETHAEDDISSIKSPELWPSTMVII